MPDQFDLWREMGEEILESPDSDSPRLRFAAALETVKDTSDEGRIRARFIRVQLRLASLETDHPEWMRLATEALSLILDYEKRWTPARYQQERIRRPEFHRGFVEYITVAAAELLEMRRVIFSDAPIRHMRQVRGRHDSQDGRKLAAHAQTTPTILARYGRRYSKPLHYAPRFQDRSVGTRYVTVTEHGSTKRVLLSACSRNSCVTPTFQPR